jgi:hypothetical protein
VERSDRQRFSFLLFFAEKLFRCCLFDCCFAVAEPIARPGALPVRLPTGSTRSFRNQLVRLDLCSFISSSVHPFCNLLMLGTEQNERFGSAVAAAAAASEHINIKPDSEFMKAGTRENKNKTNKWGKNLVLTCWEKKMSELKILLWPRCRKSSSWRNLLLFFAKC